MQINDLSTRIPNLYSLLRVGTNHRNYNILPILKCQLKENPSPKKVFGQIGTASQLIYSVIKRYTSFKDHIH